MLNLFVRTSRTWSHPQSLVTCFQQRLQLFSSLTIKDILYETSNEAGTLLTRFAKHIGIESYKFDSLLPTTIRYADFFPVHDSRVFQNEIRTISSQQLPALIIFAFTYRSNGDPVKFVKVLNDIDSTCVKRLSEMDSETMLRTLYALLFLIPNKITRTDFYKSAMHSLVQDFTADFPKEKFVQVCFYLGLAKKNTALYTSSLLKDFLEKHLASYIQELSAMDMAVVTSAIYKTATQVNCEAFNQRLQLETISAQSDDALLVTFVKNLRFQRVKSEKICKHLKNICDPIALRKLQTTGLVHIFGYFAENHWDDSECTAPLVSEFMLRLGELKKFQKSVEHVRAKDICMFLWCTSQLNCNLTESELQYLESIVLDKVENDEFKNFPDQLVDCCLSLWTIGLKSQNVLRESVNLKGNTKHNTKHRVQPKIDTRLTVLQSAASIEYPTWMPSVKNFNENSAAPTYLLKSRQDLTKYAKQLLDEDEIASATIVCPIKGINIPGILVEFADSTPKLFVELLGNEQLLRFSQEPVAIMKLKIRLLTALGYKVICLRPNDLGEQYTCLKDLLFNGEDGNGVREHSYSSI